MFMVSFNIHSLWTLGKWKTCLLGPSAHFLPCVFSQHEHVATLSFSWVFSRVVFSHLLAWLCVAVVSSSWLTNIVPFHFALDLCLNSSADICLSASVSICPTPEFLFLYFLIKSMFNIILMSKCSLFQLQIEFICLSWKSFTQPHGLRNKGSLQLHSSVLQSFYQSTNWWSCF